MQKEKRKSDYRTGYKHLLNHIEELEKRIDGNFISLEELEERMFGDFYTTEEMRKKLFGDKE